MKLKLADTTYGWERKMKFTAIIFLTLVLASLFDVAPAAQAASQVATPEQKKAWADCQQSYHIARTFPRKDRWGFIEQCFKSRTGMYPAQLQLQCTLRVGC